METNEQDAVAGLAPKLQPAEAHVSNRLTLIAQEYFEFLAEHTAAGFCVGE